MSIRGKKKDDELLIWAIVGGMFTLFLIFIDFGYSSVSEMGKIAQSMIWVGHGFLATLWVGTLAYWKDPNYDYFRKFVLGTAVLLSLIIGIHHAITREDDQILIDSKENAAKP